MTRSYLFMISLFIYLLNSESPTIHHSLNVDLSEFSPGITFSNLDGDWYDTTPGNQTLHLLYDETTQCYVYWTHKKVYRGTCGSLTTPSFPLVGATHLSADYKWSEVGDANWNTKKNSYWFWNDAGGFPTMRYARTWWKGQRTGISLEWLYWSWDDWRFHVRASASYKQGATSVQDYDIGYSLSGSQFSVIQMKTDNWYEMREWRYYDVLPNIIERNYVIDATNSDASQRGFSSCVTVSGFLHCLIDSQFLILDLSKEGVAHRYFQDYDWRVSRFYSLRDQFILPWKHNADKMYLILRRNTDSDLNYYVEILTRSTLSTEILSEYWRIGTDQISNAAFINEGPSDESKYILTSETGKFYLIHNDEPLSTISAQFGLGISSMYFKSGTTDSLVATGWATLNIDLGLIFQVNIIKSNSEYSIVITDVIILGDEKAHTMIYDDLRKGLIVLTDNGKDTVVYIVPTLPSIKVSNYKKTYENVLFSNDAVYDSGTMSIRVSQRDCENTCNVFEIELDNCAEYSCESCGQTNPVFCGSCGTTTTCSDDILCSNNFVRGKSCPYLIGSSTALLGNTAGGTTVNFFFAGPAISDVECIFGEISVMSTVTSETSFSCVSPENEEGLVTITFSDYSDEFEFEYYDCESLDCADCLSSEYSECGWNSLSSSCETEGISSIDYCPGITNIIPSAILLPTIDENGSPILVVSSGLSEDVEYRCRFIELSVETSATVVNDGGSILSVQCNTPSNTTLNDHIGDLISIELLSSYDGGQWNVHTQIHSPVYFVVNFCSDIILCGSCLNLGCEYCDDYTCSETCSPLSTIDVCPVMNTPSITSDLTSGGSNMTIVVDNLFPVFTEKRELIIPLLCVFETETNKYTVSADIDGNVVNCVTPTGVVPGIYNFYLADGDATEIVDSISFEFYDCPGKVCYECISSDYPKCAYCEGECVALGNCTFEGCPEISSISPTTVPYTGGEIAITTEFFPESGNVTCVVNDIFSDPLSFNDKIVTCAVSKSSPGLKKVYLTIGNEITSIREIEMYDCSHTESCVNCLSDNYPECSFCGGLCQLQCPGQKQGCPVIERVFPVVAEIVPRNITMKFETNLPSNAQFRCYFVGTQTKYSEGHKIDENTILCSLPDGILEDSYTLQLSVLYPSKSDFELYSVYDEDIYLFSCSGDTTCDESCFSQYCTFCPGKGCLGNSTVCSESYISTCPSISDVSSVSYSVGTSKVISLTIDGFVPSGENDLFCFFTDSNNVVYETPANISGNIVSCFTPILESTDSVTLNIKYGSTIITTTEIDIFVVDCSVASLCDSSLVETLCINIDYCGWCVSSHSCVGLQECEAESIFLVDSVCPQFERISPEQVKSIDDSLYLIGSYFHPFDLVAQIVDDFVTVTYVNETHLLIETLPSSIPRDQELQIFLEFSDGSGDYFPYGRKFTVESDPEPNYLWLIILLCCLFLIIIILAIVGILILKKKNEYNIFAGVNITLERPDFSDLAYGKDGSVLEYSNLPKDNFDVFEDLLMNDKSKVILNSFLDTLNPTDQDRGTKYFVYLTEINGCTTEFIQASMETEIGTCDDSATIFRGNSNASKMFKTYSKITGSPYIFDTLGKYIQQLSAISDTELGAYGLELELDEFKAKDADLESNSMQLKFVCNKILTAILTSVNEIPLSFKEIFHHVAMQIDIAGFEEADTSLFAVGGLYFLRFVIPSIFAPHLYGLLPQPPSVKTQRSLVLIAKVIQNIANMVLPGKKEEYMMYLNSYIATSIPKVKAFYEELTDLTSGSLSPSPKAPTHLRMNSLCALYTIFEYNRNKIEEHIMRNTEFPEPFLRKIEIAISNYETPTKIKQQESNLGTKKKTKTQKH